jgi:elongation factor P
MLGLTDLKNGVVIDLDGSPFMVVDYQHSKLGRGGAIMRTKLRNLKTNALVDMTFKGSDRFEEAALERHECTFLYQEGPAYTFMDKRTFEQFTLKSEVIGNKGGYLKEGADVQILFFDGQPVNVELPIKLDFTVTHTEPGVRGDTAQGGTKPATLETGITVTVPLFVKIGDVVRVNTQEGTYVERVKQ